MQRDDRAIRGRDRSRAMSVGARRIRSVSVKNCRSTASSKAGQDKNADGGQENDDSTQTQNTSGNLSELGRDVHPTLASSTESSIVAVSRARIFGRSAP